MSILEGILFAITCVGLWSIAVACEGIGDELTRIRQLAEEEE
jgi:hypothetical protein